MSFVMLMTNPPSFPQGWGVVSNQKRRVGIVTPNPDFPGAESSRRLHQSLMASDLINQDKPRKNRKGRDSERSRGGTRMVPGAMPQAPQGQASPQGVPLSSCSGPLLHVCLHLVVGNPLLHGALHLVLDLYLCCPL